MMSPFIDKLRALVQSIHSMIIGSLSYANVKLFTAKSENYSCPWCTTQSKAEQRLGLTRVSERRRNTIDAEMDASLYALT